MLKKIIDLKKKKQEVKYFGSGMWDAEPLFFEIHSNCNQNLYKSDRFLKQICKHKQNKINL